MRFRTIYMGIGGLLVLTLWFLTDPDLGIIQNMGAGASTLATLLILLKTVLYVGMLHLSRRALIDYIDLKIYFLKAIQTPEGAGQATIAIAIIMLSIAIVMLSSTL